MQPTPETVEGTVSLLSKADSTLLIFLVVILVGLWVLAPRWGKYVSTKNADTALLISVVKQNTEAYTGLRVVLEQGNSHCDSCKAEQMVLFTKLIDKVDVINGAVAGIEKRTPNAH